jgi:hypothetical protein
MRAQKLRAVDVDPTAELHISGLTTYEMGERLGSPRQRSECS